MYMTQTIRGYQPQGEKHYKKFSDVTMTLSSEINFQKSTLFVQKRAHLNKRMKRKTTIALLLRAKSLAGVPISGGTMVVKVY